MGDRFDFEAAQQLVSLVDKAAKTLEGKNAELTKSFSRLHEHFSDVAYENLAEDMQKSDRAVKALLEQMEETSRSISNYADRLRDAL